jgi:hypothetical protein
MDINSREWYDIMKKHVSGIMGTLFGLQCSFIGYITTDIEEHQVTISWTRVKVTITTGEYKWEMPLGWFIPAEMVQALQERPTPDVTVPKQPERREVVLIAPDDPSARNVESVDGVTEIYPVPGTLAPDGVAPTGIPENWLSTPSAAQIMAERFADE